MARANTWSGFACTFKPISGSSDVDEQIVTLTILAGPGSSRSPFSVNINIEKEAWKPLKPVQSSLYTIHLLPGQNFGLLRIRRILDFLIYCNNVLVKCVLHSALQQTF